MKWYYAVNKERIGPVEDPEFKRLIHSGIITSQTLIWNPTFSDWKRLCDTTEYIQIISNVEGTLGYDDNNKLGKQFQCSECKGYFSDNATVAFGEFHICATCKPLFVQKIYEGIIEKGPVYAGFWIRFRAKIVDTIIILFFCLFIGIPIFNIKSNDTFNYLLYALPTFFTMAYYTVFLGKFSATPGKMVFGLRVIKPDRQKITYLQSFGRYFAEQISGMVLLIGYCIAGWDEEKRTLHDRICNTRVIKTIL